MSSVILKSNRESKSPPCREEQAERGAIIPILAVMSLAIIATVTILGLETTRAKDAATSLRLTVDRICKNVAAKAAVPHEAMALFRREINELIPISPFVKITGATLTLPLPLNTVTGALTDHFFAFNSPQPNTCKGVFRSFKPAHTQNDFIQFSELSPGLLCRNTAAAPELSDCLLKWTVCKEDGTPIDKYPPSMWSDIQSPGNMVGCEVSAAVEYIFSFGRPVRKILARVAWANAVRVRDPYLADRSLPDDQSSSFTGLSLGIATQMTTWAGTGLPLISGYDDRFNFSAYPAFLSDFNPRRAPSPGETPQRLNFPPMNAPTVVGSRPLQYPATFGVSDIGLPPNHQLLESDGSTNRASEEFLTACMNPLVLIRNLIATTLVELAARHGQLRNLTQVASINPRHIGGAWESYPNRPVEIVGFGEDLTARSYQHPFVTFYSEPTSNPVLLALGGTQFGFILPWRNRLTTLPAYYSDEKRLRAQTRLSQMLRYCLHLWDIDLIARPQLPLHSEIPKVSPPEFSFWPSLQDGISPWGADQTFYNTWDYGDPWEAPPPPAPPYVSRLLNAAEVVQSLGSSQLCPAPEAPGGANSLPCKSPNFNPARDLEPDLKAYLASQLPGAFKPYPSPGLFHPVNSSNGPISAEDQINPGQPMYLTSASPVPPPRSIVTIITTKGLKEGPPSPYHLDLQGLVQALNNAGRPVIVVFIPATGAESNTAPNYCSMLRRGLDCSTPAAGAEKNRLFLLSPYLAEYGPTYNAATEGGTFINYWTDLLSSNGNMQDLYAPNVGETIFREAIVGLEPRL